MTALIILGACVGFSVLLIAASAGVCLLINADLPDPIGFGIAFGWVVFCIFGIPPIVLNLAGVFP